MIPQEQDGQTVEPTSDDLDIIRSIIANRVDRTGVAEALVLVQGTDRIVVEMPGVQDAEQVRDLVGQTSRLDFVPLGDTQASQGQVLDLEEFPPLFSGEQVDSAAIGADPNTNARVVTFVLKSEGAQLFEQYTRDHTGEFFAIVLDGEVISAPEISRPIPGGRVQITSGLRRGFLQEAQNLVTVLEFGSLRLIEAGQHDDQPHARRRVPAAEPHRRSHRHRARSSRSWLSSTRYGVVAAGALIYYALVVFALFRLVPVTLTLAGIAAFVLSVGMAVDANILVFERMKEGLRLGKSLPAAIEAGFAAPELILDSNVSSLITRHDPVPVRLVQSSAASASC